MAGELRNGDLVTYHGATARTMQRCRVRVIFRCGDLGLTFPDGVCARAPRGHVTKIIAPQYEPEF